MRAVVGVTAALVLAWTLTGQISAAKYSNDSGDLITRNYPKPLTWLDDISGGEPVLYLGQNINTGAALGIWLTEFWNRSLKHVWSLDGTAPGPGPVLTPDLVATDGRLSPDPGARYVLAERGVDVDGELVARPPKTGRWFVYKLNGPLRLAHAETGVFTDGWMGAERVQPVRVAERPGREHGRAARALGLGRPGQARSRADPGQDARQGRRQAASYRRSDRHAPLDDPQPFASDLRHSRAAAAVPRRGDRRPTFSPSDYEGESDRRELGAQVGYVFIPRGSR